MVVRLSQRITGHEANINLPLFSIVVVNNERPTGQKQLLDGRTVENKGKLILTEIFPSVQKRDI